MKPLNLLALLLFLGGATWSLTQSERTVREIQAAYYRAISPFLTGGSALETQARAFLDEVDHSKALEARLEVIEKNYNRLLWIEGQLRLVEAENDRLRAALEFKERVTFAVVAAQVTRRRPTTWWQTVEIDRGEQDGIATAYPVVTDQGLVGKIDGLYAELSTVVLLTDEACQVAAKVEGSPEEGIVSGLREQIEGSPLLQLRFLSREARLKKGMRVFSSGRGGVFPADLLIGEVVEVDPGPLGSAALIRPAVDFENLRNVFVLTPQEEER